jgi:hypothetical protein
MRYAVVGLAAAVAIITAGSTVSPSACGYGGSHHGGSHYGGYGGEHVGGFASRQYGRSGDRQPPYSRRSGSSDYRPLGGAGAGRERER